MENAQTDNSAACGQSRSTVGLERMFRVVKTDHPDLVGGIVWADCELRWINERITLAILAEREQCAMLAENSMAKGGHLVAEWIRMRSNVELTGAARLHRAASSDRRERG